MNTLAYVRLEAAGIQRFICGTGKLKEMIGGSEIINTLAAKAFYRPVCRELGLHEAASPGSDDSWFVELQANAGTLCLVLPNRHKAARFLHCYSKTVLERFPGLPLFGTQTEMLWTKESYREARQEAERRINRQRAVRPVASGMPVLPVVRTARLDGLPAVETDGEEFVSLPSRTRRDPEFRKRSQERLRAMVKAPEGVPLHWPDDPVEMVGGEGQKVALVHMDGNDLGKLFRTRLEESERDTLDTGARRMRQLSELIAELNTNAFSVAAQGILMHELRAAGTKNMPHRLVMPLRPLVMGGDDITVIVRADAALAFVELFTRTFERQSAARGTPLSLGAGMVVMPASYPFAKAFSLVEGLLKNAKEATKNLNPRPSSLDYLILTEEVESDVDALRRRVFTAEDGARLTAKPLLLHRGRDSLAAFMRDGAEVLDFLPRSLLRRALDACRAGEKAVETHWENLRENLRRRLGGRRDSKLMTLTRFDELFPEGFFFGERVERQTRLGDYLELVRLLPQAAERRRDLLEHTLKEDAAHV